MIERPSGPDFEPVPRVARYFDFGGEVTWPRLLLRVIVALLALVLVDVSVDRFITSQYSLEYRLPRSAPSAYLPGYLDAYAKRTKDASSTHVVFVGASPTWGYRVRDVANTFPYAFASAAASEGVPIAAANLASNGQLIGDEFVVARRAAEDADVVFVQLTYHTFAPSARHELVRYPELAKNLGVRLSAPEAHLMGLEPPRRYDISRPLGQLVAARWALYRERNAIAARAFGGEPEQVLHDAWTKWRTGEAPVRDDEDVATDEFEAFDALEPEQQMIVVSRYAEQSAFNVWKSEAQMKLLGRLAEQLRADGRKAVFFMAPMNRDAIDAYGLIDPEQYAANSAKIGAVVEAAGFPYLDYNTAEMPVLPGTMFADIDHTTDEGGAEFGRILARDTLDYVAGASAGVTP